MVHIFDGTDKIVFLIIKLLCVLKCLSRQKYILYICLLIESVIKRVLHIVYGYFYKVL